MVGQLVRNEVEIGATPLFMTVDRVALIQYIAQPTSAGSRFIFRAPKLSYTDNVYLLPFDSFVWMCLCGLVLFTAFTLAISVFVEWKMQSAQTNEVVCLMFLPLSLLVITSYFSSDHKRQQYVASTTCG